LEGWAKEDFRGSSRSPSSLLVTGLTEALSQKIFRFSAQNYYVKLNSRHQPLKSSCMVAVADFLKIDVLRGL